MKNIRPIAKNIINFEVKFQNYDFGEKYLKTLNIVLKTLK